MKREGEERREEERKVNIMNLLIMSDIGTKRSECGISGKNNERVEGDRNSADIVTKVTKFRKAQQGGTAVRGRFYRYLVK